MSEKTVYTYHNSVENCLDKWGADPDATGYPAGRAMAKALKSVGVSWNNGTAGRVHVTATSPGRTSIDSYTLFVKDTATAEKIAKELWKDSRVTEVSVNGNAFPKRTIEDAEKELADLKAEVYRKAKALAKRHNWCSVVDDALKELGIEPPPNKAKVTVVIDLPEGVDATDLDAVKRHVRGKIGNYDNRDQFRDSITATEKV